MTPTDPTFRTALPSLSAPIRTEPEPAAQGSLRRTRCSTTTRSTLIGRFGDKAVCTNHLSCPYRARSARWLSVYALACYRLCPAGAESYAIRLSFGRCGDVSLYLRASSLCGRNVGRRADWGERTSDREKEREREQARARARASQQRQDISAMPSQAARARIRVIIWAHSRPCPSLGTVTRRASRSRTVTGADRGATAAVALPAAARCRRQRAGPAPERAF